MNQLCNQNAIHQRKFLCDQSCLAVYHCYGYSGGILRLHKVHLSDKGHHDTQNSKSEAGGGILNDRHSGCRKGKGQEVQTNAHHKDFDHDIARKNGWVEIDSALVEIPETNDHDQGLKCSGDTNKFAKVRKVIYCPIDVPNKKAVNGRKQREGNANMKIFDLAANGGSAQVRIDIVIQEQMQDGNVEGTVCQQTQSSANMTKKAELVVDIGAMDGAHTAHHLRGASRQCQLGELAFLEASKDVTLQQ